jgi:hypothetical protein
MDVNQVYQVVLYALSKNRQQGYLSPDDFYTVINTAQRSYLDYLMGEFQKYQIKRPIAVVEFGQNERIRQSLAPLIYGRILSPFPYSGINPFPSDYEYPDAMWTYNFKKVKFIQQDSLSSYYNSRIDPIATNPVYLIKHEGFQFYPTTIGYAELSYIRTPPSIVWAYRDNSNGQKVYDASNSQQPIWAETDMLEVIVRALALCGVNLQLGAVIQYASDVKNGGQ